MNNPRANEICQKINQMKIKSSKEKDFIIPLLNLEMGAVNNVLDNL
jgi:hypothetical protein